MAMTSQNPQYMKARFVIVMAAGLLCSAGCRPAKPNNHSDNSLDVNTTSEVTSTRNTSTKPTDSSNVTSVANGVGAQASQPANSFESPKAPILGTKHRVVLFPPDGPLLIEFDIAVMDRPLDGTIESILDEAITLADADQNGRVTWDELFESGELESRFFANSTVLDEGIDETKRQYDLNVNGFVDRYELPRLLTGGMGGGQPFGLRSSNYYRDINRFASPLFRYLDTDHNGNLSSDEIQNSSRRLRARDFDDDEYVSLTDLPLDDIDYRETRNNVYQPHVAVWLGPRNPWESIRLALTELYADGDTLSSKHFTLAPELFGELDADGNKRLSLLELAKLAVLPPHVAMTVRLSSQDASLPVFSAVTLCESLQRAGVTAHVVDTWIRLELPESRIDLIGRELPAESSLAENASSDDMASSKSLVSSQVRLQASHRADALFAALDNDGDQRLAPQELDSVGDVIARLDIDQSGALTVNELPDFLIVGLSQGGDQQADESPYQTRIIAPVNVDTPDWFQAMDHNGDGQLSRREFLGVRSKFHELDADQDGYLGVDEVLP